ncbi:hypothetical protein [uncultured Kocuria sp.]|nr:hypothetical protein [uncultured Kocuria sp.]
MIAAPTSFSTRSSAGFTTAFGAAPRTAPDDASGRPGAGRG